MRKEQLDYLPWVVGGTCFIGSLCLPAHAKTIWIVGVGSLLPLMWKELRKPVNYLSLEFDSVGFVFQLRRNIRTTVEWAEVSEVFYCRSFNDFANQIDTEWHFVLRDGRHVEVLVEWPHRARFAEAVVRNLGHVSSEAVRRVAGERKEGRWSVVGRPRAP